MCLDSNVSELLNEFRGVASFMPGEIFAYERFGFGGK